MLETRRNPFAPLLLILAALASSPLVGKPAKPSPPPPAAQPAPSSVHMAWHSTPEERARLEREVREAQARRQADERRRIARLRPQLEAWSLRYRSAARPLHAALADAIAHLARGRGPESQTVCYPVTTTLADLVATVPRPAPDPRLDGELGAALLSLQVGADACTRGLPATGLRLLRDGEGRLSEVEAILASYLVPLRALGSGDAADQGFEAGFIRRPFP